MEFVECTTGRKKFLQKLQSTKLPKCYCWRYRQDEKNGMNEAYAGVFYLDIRSQGPKTRCYFVWRKSEWDEINLKMVVKEYVTGSFSLRQLIKLLETQKENYAHIALITYVSKIPKKSVKTHTGVRRALETVNFTDLDEVFPRLVWGKRLDCR